MWIHYIIKEEQGIVVAILKDTDFELLKDLGAKEIVNITSEMYDTFALNNQYKGIARLSDGDTWNEDFGKKVAKEKAVLKLKEAKIKKLTKLRQYLVDEATSVNNLITKIRMS